MSKVKRMTDKELHKLTMLANIGDNFSAEEVQKLIREINRLQVELVDAKEAVIEAMSMVEEYGGVAARKTNKLAQTKETIAKLPTYTDTGEHFVLFHEIDLLREEVLRKCQALDDAATEMEALSDAAGLKATLTVAIDELAGKTEKLRLIRGELSLATASFEVAEAENGRLNDVLMKMQDIILAGYERAEKAEVELDALRNTWCEIHRDDAPAGPCPCCVAVEVARLTRELEQAQADAAVTHKAACLARRAVSSKYQNAHGDFKTEQMCEARRHLDPVCDQPNPGKPNKARLAVYGKLEVKS